MGNGPCGRYQRKQQSDRWSPAHFITLWKKDSETVFFFIFFYFFAFQHLYYPHWGPPMSSRVVPSFLTAQLNFLLLSLFVTSPDFSQLPHFKNWPNNWTCPFSSSSILLLCLCQSPGGMASPPMKAVNVLPPSPWPQLCFLWSLTRVGFSGEFSRCPIWVGLCYSKSVITQPL